MKTLIRLFVVTITATLIGVTVMYGNKALAFASNVSKAQTYENLLQPETDTYYSVESVTKKDGSIFVIGQKVKPMIGGKVAPQGQLVTIEVPAAKGTGLVKGPFLTVNEGVTKYFLNESDLVQHALDN
jgi:hypothetical protein